MPNSPKKLKYMIWSNYCKELLLGGRNTECIKEIEDWIKNENTSYDEFIMNKLPIMETLGMAYFRLGEANNCLNNHNEYSCILPLLEEGQHKDKIGSKNQNDF